MRHPYRGWFWRFAPLFRRVLGSREPVKTGILDANRILEITYVDEYRLCLELANAVLSGCDTITWNALAPRLPASTPRETRYGMLSRIGRSK